MDESEAANDRSKRGSAFFSNSLLNRNFFEPEVGCFFFLLFNSKCWASHIISVSWAFASCLPFSYRSDILWGRDGIIIDNKPWPANDTRIDCLKGATVDDGSGLRSRFRGE